MMIVSVGVANWIFSYTVVAKVSFYFRSQICQTDTSKRNSALITAFLAVDLPSSITKLLKPRIRPLLKLLTRRRTRIGLPLNVFNNLCCSKSSVIPKSLSLDTTRHKQHHNGEVRLLRS